MTVQTTPDTTQLVAAAAAAAEVLPAVTALAATAVQPGNEHVTAPFAGATIALVEGLAGGPHRIAVLVGEELVKALAESPLGGLDLAAATQPAIDAAAAVLGGSAGAAAEVALTLVVSDLAGPFSAVPLVGQGIDAAVLFSDTLLSPVLDAGEVIVTAVEVGPVDVQVADAPPAGQAVPAPTPMFSPSARPTGPAPVRGIEMLAGVDMEITVELGRTRMPVRDLLALAPGTVLELDRAADGPADLLVNGRLIARGEVVVIDEDFGLRITEILDDTVV